MEPTPEPSKPTQPSRRGPGLRVAIALGLLLVAYLALGYVVVPRIVEHQVVAMLTERSGFEPTVTDLRFDPLRFRLGVDGFAWGEGASSESAAGEDAMLSFDRLVVDFRPSGWLTGAPLLAEVRLVNPRVRAEIAEDGGLNLSTLISAGSETENSDAEAEEPSEGFEIAVSSIEIESGEILFRDLRSESDSEVTLADLDLEVQDFTTRIGESFEYDVAMRIAKEGRLASRGSLGLDPPAFAGELEVDAFPLRVPWKFFERQLGFEVDDGRVGLTARIEASFADTPEWTVSGATLEVRDLSLLSNPVDASNVEDEGREFLELPSVSVSGIEATGRSSSLSSFSVEMIEVAGGLHAISRDADGQWNVVSAFTPRNEAGAPAPASDAARSETEPAPSGEADAPPPRIRIGQMTLSEFEIAFDDRLLANPVAVRIAPLKVEVKDFDSEGTMSFDVDLDAGIGEAGRVELKGHVELEPLVANFDASIRDAGIGDFVPYARPWARIRVTSGTLTSRLAVEVADRGVEGYRVSSRGRLTLADLHAVDDRQNELFSWNRLELENFEVSDESTHVEDVSLDGASLWFEIERSGTSRLASVFGAEGTEPKDDSESGGGEYGIRIDRLKLEAGSMTFRDASVEPAFELGFDRLAGSVEQLSNESAQGAKVALEGRVNGAAPMVLRGDINPFRAESESEIETSIKGLSMPPFAAYSERYVGYGIAQGKLDLELDYRLDERFLTAENHFRLDRFRFGNRVRSGLDATLLPVPLAFTLMRDAQGEIEIDLPIKGNLDDPSFSLLSTIGKAFVKLIRNVVSAPFGIVGGLVNFSVEDLSSVYFEPGKVEFEDGERAKVEGLAGALAERPELRLAIHGRADPKVDGGPVGTEKSEAAARKLADARAAAILAQLLDHEGVTSEQIFLGQIEIGDFGEEKGVPTELSLESKWWSPGASPE